MVSSDAPAPAAAAEPAETHAEHPPDTSGRFSLGRVWAFARRETVELMRDPIRIAFALLGPILLMIVFGYGISLDVDHLPFAVLDFDNSPSSRAYVDAFRGSYYFVEQQPLTSYDDLNYRLRDGELRIALEIPSGFERDLLRGRKPEVAAYLDAAIPFRAELTRNYVQKVNLQYSTDLRVKRGLPTSVGGQPVHFNVRLLYNQAFKSVYAMVPADIMLLLILIPCMLTALAVVREKELGSIANFYSAPATRFEFLIGKQMPYLAVSFIQFASLVLVGLLVFQVPMKGSWATLISGGALYLVASVGFGLLISVFAPTQTSAIFAAAIITILPAIQFSGMYAPVSSLTGTARLLSRLFPSTYFQAISVGTFTKAIGFAALWRNFVAIAITAILYFSVSVTLLQKQER